MTETIERMLRPGQQPLLPRGAEDLDRTIVDAAKVVLARFGPDGFSLNEVAKVSLVPIPRIYQRFADSAEILGALSTRALRSLTFAVEAPGPQRDDQYLPGQIRRLIDGIAEATQDPITAYLVLCGPFDKASTQSRLEVTDRLGGAIARALEHDSATGAALRASEDPLYAAEIIFACLRRGFLAAGRITSTATDRAYRAAVSFVSIDAHSSPQVDALIRTITDV